VFVPLMLKNGYGRVVNLSSGMGQLTEMNGGWPGYRISKIALNAVTRIFADETAGSNVLINSVCPGWVRTDMGGQEAERSPAEAAEGIVWLATLPDGGPTGGFYRDKAPIAW
jgi:NAD(P)-dependent dehydrogenase (short-subunit alcohol dehydrogenase family)